MIGRKALYSGDWFDEGFRQRYPSERWIGDNALCFLLDAPRRSARQDRVVLTNEAKAPLEYVLVDSEDLCLVLDLQPGTTHTVMTPTPKAQNASWLSVAGLFADGRELPITGRNFRLGSGEQNPTEYRIVIANGGGVTMTRLERDSR
jgi:hypothetical protein